MEQLRISKYNPEMRDDKGNYFHFGEWTSLSDIEKGIMTIDHYIKSESNYVNSIIHIMEIAQIEHVYITDIEIYSPNTPVYIADENLQLISSLHEGKKIFRDDVNWIVRCVLRELMWCKLIDNNKFYIHFGYDYYVYVGGDFNLVDHDSLQEGVFYEKFKSPYLL